MRRLYFDIDGTLLVGDTGEPKAALAGGAFEHAVRQSGIEGLVCVGNFVDAARAAREIDASYDDLAAIFRICRGVFSDRSWFCASTSLVGDSVYRATDVDLEADWWYIDDLAEYYFRVAGRQDVFRSNVGSRIMVPSPDGDGSDVLNWISKIPEICAF
jgi:hypothetical protein